MADIQPPTPDWLHSVIGLKSHHVVAGVAGGIARGLVGREFSWPQRLTSAVVGAMVAGYGTPVCTPFMHALVAWVHNWLGTTPAVPPLNLEGSTGFALGLIGMSLCDVAIRWAKRWLENTLPAIVKKD